MGSRQSAYAVSAAASALTRPAAAPALEVRERAVTQAEIRGQVCPTPGGAAFTLLGSDLFAQVGFQRSGISARNSAVIGDFSVMSNASISKPRFGYRATSGTG
jgi:hypothetical protein